MRSRLGIAAASLLATAVLGLYLFAPGTPKRIPFIADMRCVYGCALPALQVLPVGALPSLRATGAVNTATGGAVSTTRASTKVCGNSTGGVTAVSSNQPCVDGTGLLVEAAATNLAIQSNNFSNAAWSANQVTMAQGDASCGTAPDGSAGTAWLVTPNGGATDAYFFQAVTNSTHAPFAGAVWVKNPTGQTLGRSILMRVDGAHGPGSASGADLTATAEWTRYTWTTDLTGDTNTVVRILIGTNASWLQATGPFCFAFAQLEQVSTAASVSSSYIPTTTVAVTRPADNVSIANVALGTAATSAGFDGGTIALWPFDDTGSTSADSTGNYAMAAYLGPPASTLGVIANARTTTTGTCFISSTLSAADTNTINGAAWSIGGWIRPAADVANNSTVMLVNGPNLGTQVADYPTVALFYDTGNHRLYFYDYIAAGNAPLVTIGSANSVPLSAWTRFDWTRTNNGGSQGGNATWNFYINRVSVGSYTGGTLSVASNANQRIGLGGYRDVGGTYPAFHGDFDNWQIQRGVLTAAQIAANPSATPPTVTPSFGATVALPALPSGTAMVMQAYNSSTDKWGGWFTSGGAFRCEYNNGAANGVTTSATVAAGSTSRVRCYYDGTNIGACINGACTTAAASFVSSASYASLFLGSDNGTASFLSGGESSICQDRNPNGCT